MVFLSLNCWIDKFLLIQLVSIMGIAVTLILTFFLFKNNYLLKGTLKEIVKVCTKWLFFQYLTILVSVLALSFKVLFDLHYLTKDSKLELFKSYFAGITSKFLISLMNPTFILCLLIISILFLLILGLCLRQAKEENRIEKLRFTKVLIEKKGEVDRNFTFNKIETKKWYLSSIFTLISVFLFGTIYMFSRDYQIEQPSCLTTDQFLFLIANLLLSISMYYFWKVSTGFEFIKVFRTWVAKLETYWTWLIIT